MRNLQISERIANRDNPSVEKYFTEVGRERLITAQEEVMLAARIRQGDKEALDKLVRCNLRFVISVAKRYQYQGLPLSDLISEGNIGLIKAAERFDETRGFKFISFAVWWIRQSISAAINEQARMIRLPMNKIHDITRINKTIAELEQETLRLPTIEQLADRLEKPKEHVRDTMGCAPWTSSYDVCANEDGFTMLDNLAHDGAPPDGQLIAESRYQEVRQLLSSLSERERKIIEMSFGMDGGHEMNPVEISKCLGMSSERIRQLRNAALETLKNRAGTEFEMA